MHCASTATLPLHGTAQKCPTQIQVVLDRYSDLDVGDGTFPLMKDAKIAFAFYHGPWQGKEDTPRSTRSTLPMWIKGGGWLALLMCSSQVSKGPFTAPRLLGQAIHSFVQTPPLVCNKRATEETGGKGKGNYSTSVTVLLPHGRLGSQR